MMTRTTSRTVTFAYAFRLNALESVQPPGSYVIETEEELIQDLSFPAYRRTGTWLRLPGPGKGVIDRVVNVDAADLDAALAGDAALGAERRAE